MEIGPGKGHERREGRSGYVVAEFPYIENAPDPEISHHSRTSEHTDGTFSTSIHPYYLTLTINGTEHRLHIHELYILLDLCIASINIYAAVAMEIHAILDMLPGPLGEAQVRKILTEIDEQNNA